MADPTLSVIVPALNEEDGIDACLEHISRYLESRIPWWEIIVVIDDRTRDGTGERVEEWARHDPRIRLLRAPLAGKGAAVRCGMVTARGAWRMMADADLSVAPDDWGAFLDAMRASDPAEIVVGSREGEGSQRIDEPLIRYVRGRVFNWFVRVFAVPGIRDTQCGFKLFSATAVKTLFPQLTVNEAALDVEILFLARRTGFRVREVGVVWVCRRDSRVRIDHAAAAFVDVVKIRWRHRLSLTSRAASPTMNDAP